jgi:hypothetical protein
MKIELKLKKSRVEFLSLYVAAATEEMSAMSTR